MGVSRTPSGHSRSRSLSKNRNTRESPGPQAYPHEDTSGLYANEHRVPMLSRKRKAVSELEGQLTEEGVAPHAPSPKRAKAAKSGNHRHATGDSDLVFFSSGTFGGSS